MHVNNGTLIKSYSLTHSPTHNTCT